MDNILQFPHKLDPNEQLDRLEKLCAREDRRIGTAINNYAVALIHSMATMSESLFQLSPEARKRFMQSDMAIGGWITGYEAILQISRTLDVIITDYEVTQENEKAGRE